MASSEFGTYSCMLTFTYNQRMWVDFKPIKQITIYRIDEFSTELGEWKYGRHVSAIM